MDLPSFVSGVLLSFAVTIIAVFSWMAWQNYIQEPKRRIAILEFLNKPMRERSEKEIEEFTSKEVAGSPKALINKALDALEADGYIRKQHKGDLSSNQTYPHYTITIEGIKILKKIQAEISDLT